MAKKGGNKKKSNARKNQKKVVTTPTANPSTPEESSPVTPVNALDNDKANVLTEPIDQDIAKEEQQIEESHKEEEEKQTEKPSILSNASEEALTSTSENIVESLDVKETLEEPPHVQIEAKPVAITLDNLPEAEQPVVITLEKSIIPEEQQQTIDVEPVPVEISPVLPKVETEEVPLLQEKKQDQEPVVLVVSESETTSAEEEQQASALNQDQLTPEVITATTAAEQQIASEKERVAIVEPSATIATAITTEEDSSSSAKPEIQEHKVVEQIQENKQEPEQALTHENDQVPEQKEPKNLVSQAAVNETKNVQEPHVSEPVTSVIAEEASRLAEDKEINQEEATHESNENQHATTTTQSEQQVTSVPPVVIVDNVEQVVVPAQTEKETAPAVSTTSLEKEDTPTVRSQSVLTSTNTDATINEEEIITPKSSLKKSRSILGSKDKSVTKRKSQILGLFKRGGDKTPPPVPELPVITEKKQAEKKLNKRKSWMFWKSSTAVAGQQKN